MIFQSYTLGYCGGENLIRIICQIESLLSERLRRQNLQSKKRVGLKSWQICSNTLDKPVNNRKTIRIDDRDLA